MPSFHFTFSLALCADGALFSWGGGEVGQVGTGVIHNTNQDSVLFMNASSGDARDKLVPQCISLMVPIMGADGEV